VRLLVSTAFAAIAAVAAHVGAAGQAPFAACRDGGDRTTKLTLIGRLPRSPQLVVLGSSRARTAEPSFLERLTGRRGFNAAVRGGTAADAWVTVRYTYDRFPERGRRSLWFVDAGIATNGVPPDLAADPRARRYLDGVKPTAPRCRASNRYRADGSIAYESRSRAADAKAVAEGVARLVAGIRAHPPRGGWIDPRRYVYFERTIEFMNRHGSRPVIVLNPLHPRVLRELERYGWPAREAAKAYLTNLRRRLDLVVVDCEDIRTWGGSPSGFTDAKHVDRANMRRLLRYVVAHSNGALGAGAAG
jgi:hypothetical protein